MIMHKYVVYGLMTLSLSIGSIAFAEKLPKDAVKLKSSEVKAIYARKSANWKRWNGYFAPDGTLYEVKKDKSVIGKGKWSVSGNVICNNITWNNLSNGKSGKHKTCTKWYKSGKRYLSQWDGEKNKTQYWDGEMKKLKKGDTVSKNYNKLAKSM